MIKLALTVLALVSLVLTACGSSGASEESKTITVGTSPGPYSELFLDHIVHILEEDGFQIEVVEFSDLR